MTWKSSVCVVLAAAALAGVTLAEKIRLVPEERTEENYPGYMLGHITEVESTLNMGPLQMEVTIEGMEEPMVMNSLSEENEVSKVENLEGGDMRLVRRKWGAETTETFGQKQKEPIGDPLANLAILLKKTEEGFVASLENGDKPNAEQQEALSELEEEYNAKLESEFQAWDSDLATYGEEPREIGESWELDEEAISRMMGEELAQVDEMEVTVENGVATLNEVKEIDGVKYALLSIEAEMTMEGQPEDTEGIGTVKFSMDIELKRNIEQFYDAEVKIEMEGSMKMEMTDEQEGMKVKGEGPMKGSMLYKEFLPAAAGE